MSHPDATGMTGQNWNSWTLEERRTGNYTFASMRDLIRFFANWLSIEEIEEVIDRAKEKFVVRRGTTTEETKLQLIKKCEYILVRSLRGLQ